MLRMGSDHQQDHACNTNLSLGLINFNYTSNKKEKQSAVSLKFDHVLPSLSLAPTDHSFLSSGYHQISASPGSSSYSNNSNSASVKRSSLHKKDFCGYNHGKEVGMDKVSPRVSDDDDEAGPRKKLRLTKDQCAVLEESFKQQSTLNPNKKQALAKQLNLPPRQVEVWFQNRRARTKLKQTEMDCELLKKRLETLTEENKRLQKEVKALKMASPVYMAHTLSMCPSCDKLVNAADHHYYASPAGGNRSLQYERDKAATVVHTHLCR